MESGYWLEAQIAAAILCISVPTLRPLLPKDSLLGHWLKRYYGIRGGSTGQNWKWPSTPSHTNEQYQHSGTDEEWAKRYRALSDDNSDKAVLTRTYAGTESREPSGAGIYPMNAILVREDIEVV